MSQPRCTQPWTTAALIGALVTLAAGTTAGRLAAQAPSPETTRLKQAYLADLADLEQKYVALAEAFPADLYGWRPMPGVRSVSQVLGLISIEYYNSVVPAFGGTPPAEARGDGAWERFEALTDKATLVRHLKTSITMAREAVTQWSGPADQPISFWGENRTPAALFTVLMADQHEHLGQLIAYARMNRIVPPWSRK